MRKVQDIILKLIAVMGICFFYSVNDWSNRYRQKVSSFLGNGFDS